MLLQAMGAERANIHLGSTSALPALRRDLEARGPDWLRDAARRMAKATLKDWNAWRAS